MARGNSRAQSEESQAIRRQAQALLNKAQAMEAQEMADKLASRDKAKAPAMRAIMTSMDLIGKEPPGPEMSDFERKVFNQRLDATKERLAKAKALLDASRDSKEFFEKLGEASVKTVEGMWSVERGLLYNGMLDGKARATQFLDSVKVGLKEGAFGDQYRDAKVTFKGARKDEVRIDLPEGTVISARSDLRAAIRSLGTSMTSTRTDPGDGFGHTPMPKVVFRVGGMQFDSIDYM